MMRLILQFLRLGVMASPEMKAAVTGMIEEMERRAQATKLPIDDLVVAALKGLCMVAGLYGVGR